MSGVPDERLLALVRQLALKSRRGEASWSVTDELSQYLYSGSKSSVLVRAWVDGEGDENVYVSILNSDGLEAASVRTTFEEDGFGYKPSAHNKELLALAEEARRSALKINEVLDSLEGDLGLPF